MEKALDYRNHIRNKPRKTLDPDMKTHNQNEFESNCYSNWLIIGKTNENIEYMCKFKTYIPLKKRMLRGFVMFNLND